MYINSIGYTSNPYSRNNMAFGKNPQKQLINFLASENLEKFKMTFDEAKRICEMLGHTIEQVQGSHAKIHVKDNKGILSLVMPHGPNKYISITDKKRLIYLFTGRLSDAFRMR